MQVEGGVAENGAWGQLWEGQVWGVEIWMCPVRGLVDITQRPQGCRQAVGRCMCRGDSYSGKEVGPRPAPLCPALWTGVG